MTSVRFPCLYDVQKIIHHVCKYYVHIYDATLNRGLTHKGDTISILYKCYATPNRKRILEIYKCLPTLLKFQECTQAALGSKVKKWCEVTLIQQSQDSRGLVVQFQECTQAALSLPLPAKM
jgi:hypothetical protein